MKLLVRFLVAVVVAWGSRARSGRPPRRRPARRRPGSRGSARWSSRRPRRSGTTRSRPEWPRSGSSAPGTTSAVDATEDAAAFTDANLARYDVVVWLTTTGDVLTDAQQAAFERYIRAGGGYAGIHAASDTEYDWAWYGGLVGAYFRDHPGSVNPSSRSRR